MGLFNRIFKIGQSEANAIVDKLEDPIKMTEQGIRDLKKDLDKSLQAMAEIKALAIRNRKEMVEHENRVKSYEHKAVQLLQKAQSGAITQEEADRLATEALNKQEESRQHATVAREQYDHMQSQINKMNANVNKLRSNISKYENELKMLKARARVSKATKKLNKSIAQVDSGGTIALLERMKNKVEQDEAMAEAYGDIAYENRSVDEEIDSVLNVEKTDASSDALAALKAKLNKTS